MSRLFQGSECLPAYSCEEVLIPGITFDQSSRFGVGTKLSQVSVAYLDTTWGFIKSGYYTSSSFQKISEYQPPVFLISKGYIFYPLEADMSACIGAYPDAVFASSLYL